MLIIIDVYISKIKGQFVNLGRTKTINMKRIVNIIAAVILLTILCLACSKEICPAYSDNSSTEISSDEARS